MRAEPEEIMVRRMAQRPRGGSGDNPFLKPTRTAMEYTVIIQPQGIAKKIMQVGSMENEPIVSIAETSSDDLHFWGKRMLSPAVVFGASQSQMGRVQNFIRMRFSVLLVGARADFSRMGE